MKCPSCQFQFEVDLLGEPVRTNPVQQFIAAYVEAYTNRWKTSPITGGMYAGAAKNIVKVLGPEKAKRFAFAYIAMNDPFFLTKQHDLMTMYQNLNKIKVALDTGKVTTRTEIQQMDRRQATHNAFAHLLGPDAAEG